MSRDTSVLRTSLNRPFVHRVLAPSFRKASALVSTQDVISIVDDDRSFSGAIRRLIESAGLIVEEFPSAEEFLHSTRCHDSACLILDLQLLGMSGLELQDRLRISNPRLPIIFMSATVDEMSTTRALRSGAVGFLEKPIDEHALFAAINLCLSSPLPRV